MDEDIHGPIDFVLIEFPADADTSGAASALLDLVEQGTIRLWDLLVLRKADDGSISVVELSDTALQAFAGARSGLLGDDDIAEAAEALAPGTGAALLVYENAWAIPFVAAARGIGGEMVASSRIPAQAIIDALDELERQD